MYVRSCTYYVENSMPAHSKHSKERLEEAFQMCKRFDISIWDLFAYTYVKDIPEMRQLFQEDGDLETASLSDLEILEMMEGNDFDMSHDLVKDLYITAKEILNSMMPPLK